MSKGHLLQVRRARLGVNQSNRTPRVKSAQGNGKVEVVVEGEGIARIMARRLGGGHTFSSSAVWLHVPDWSDFEELIGRTGLRGVLV